jgi:hypothetical protein
MIESIPGTQRLMSPRCAAAAASIISPVTNISKAALRPMLRESATEGVAQNRPTLMPETAKRASSAAIARSHMATN